MLPIFMTQRHTASSYKIPQSIRFNDDDSAYMYRTPSGAGSNRKMTYSCWIKRGNLNLPYGILFNAGDDSIHFPNASNTDTLRIFFAGTAGGNIQTTQVFRDPSAWYHIVIGVDTDQVTASDRVKIEVNGVQVTSFLVATYPTLNYNVPDFNDAVAHQIGQRSTSYYDGYMAELQWIDGTAYTASDFGEFDTNGVWVPKAFAGTYGTNGFHIDGADSADLGLSADSTGQSAVTDKDSEDSEWNGTKTAFTFGTGNIDRTSTVNAIRSNDTLTGDFVIDFTATTKGTGLRLGVYAASEDSTFSSTASDNGGMDSMTNSWYWDVGNAQYRYGGVSQGSESIANGSVVTVERTGSTIKITDDASTVHTFSQTFSGPVRICIAGGASACALDNFNWTADSRYGNSYFTSGLTSADQMLDSPTDDAANGVGNYCTWNPLANGAAVGTTAKTLSDGNLTALTSAADGGIPGTLYASSGKYYFEFTVDSTVSTGVKVGVVNAAAVASADLYDYTTTSGLDMYGGGEAYAYDTTGNKFSIGTIATYGSTYTVADVIGVALDLDNGAIWFSKNGTWQASATQGEIEAGTTTNAAFTGLSGAFSILYHDFSHNGQTTANTGQSTFNTAAPSGFKSLCTANLPAPTIVDSSAYFQPVTWTGTGTTIEINQTGNSTFQPDFVWAKSRDDAYDHQLMDAVRGAGNKFSSNHSGAEEIGLTDALTSFDVDGFSMSTGTNLSWNKSGSDFIGWMWKANGAGSSNTDGSITATVSADATAGFAIANWTGTGANGTLGHGLSAAPEFIMVKNAGAADSWVVYSEPVGATKGLTLDTTATPTTASTFFNDTAPTSSVFSVGGGGRTNQSGKSMIAYCFHSVPGMSQFGTYEGNANTDGAFVHLGFAPELLMVKNIDAADSWEMYDMTRLTYNPHNAVVKADLANAEVNDVRVDLLSNGFKARSSNTAINSAHTFIYAAFAEHPFGGSGVSQARAR